MTNHELARFLQRTAQMLQISGANSFKVRAYERAAEAVAGHQEEISDLADRGQDLTELEGIGKSIATDLHQYLDRESSDTWEELVAEIPESLLDLLRIQGMGPKKVAKLYEQLGITDIAGLSAALSNGQVQELKGFGKKTSENLKKELGRLERLSGRTPIGQALPLAQSILEYLQAVPEIEQVQVCGSLRRRAETIGDLDFVATTSGSPADVMDAFVKYDESADVIGKGNTKTSVRLPGGLQVDLRVVSPDQWGSAIHHFTGSKFHHIELRARAQKMGLKVSEYGVFNVETNDLVAGQTEEEVYGALGLDWIPPELREGRGEVEASEKSALPELIELEHLRGDLHMHTVASDGGATIEEMAEAARDLGHEYICITDHSPQVLVANGLDADRMRKHLDAIRAADDKVEGIKIFAGQEVDILRDGELDQEHEVLEQLDFVVGSVHTGLRRPRDEQTARIVRAIRSGLIHAVGHPTGRRLGKRDGYELDFDAVLEAALDHNVVLEVNSSPHRMDLKDTLCRHAVEAGVRLIISSDAHSTRGLEVLHFGVSTARRGWVEPKHVLNTLPLAEFTAAVGG